jgi:hypothetical protein
MAKKEVAKGKRYGLPEILRGLTAVAYANGNCNKANRDLKEAGIKVSVQTLRNWLRDNQADYERIRREILPQVGAQVADEHMDLARKQLDGANLLADRLIKEGAELPIRDVAGAMRNFDVGSGIHTEKARELQGDFETPGKPQKPEHVLRALREKLGLPPTIDAQAVEVPIEELPGGENNGQESKA